ncbi:MAG: oxidoreductase [Candidatus Saccharibacteria bacterium]|nr:oxidoreductase [Candidatus Saccharibacteria bacterium]
MIPNLKLNNGIEIPAIGFGTWQLSEGEEVEQSVSIALKAGYRLIDTAKIYGNEYGVGKAVRESSLERKEVFITTKLWARDLGFDNAFEAFEESKNNLKLEYIDLYLIHWPGPSPRVWLDSWRALAQIYQKGDARAVGVSNFEVSHLERLLDNTTLPPAVNQIEFHPFVYKKQAPILNFCVANDIVVEAYSPLAQARQMNHPVILEIAETYSKTPAQVLLRWAIQHGTIPIPRSSNSQRIRENLDVFDFELQEEQMLRLNNLSTGVSVL